MADAFLLSAVRTPIGKYLGALADVSAPQLGAIALGEAVRRANARPDAIEEVLMGNVLQAGLGQNPARQAALKAGFPDTIAAVTISSERVYQRRRTTTGLVWTSVPGTHMIMSRGTCST